MLGQYFQSSLFIFLPQNTAYNMKYYARAVKSRIFSRILLKNYRLDFKRYFSSSIAIGDYANFLFPFIK